MTLVSAKIFKEQKEEQREENQRMNEARKQNEQESATIIKEQIEELLQSAAAETASLITEQANIITKQKQDLERMQEVIQPLSSIESYVKMAIGGFTAVKVLRNYFLSANVTWMVTAVPVLRSSRQYMYAVFTLGLLAELGSLWILESEELFAVDTVRFLTRVVAVITMILVAFVACFFPPKKGASSITMDDILKSQMEFVTKLNASAPMEAKYMEAKYERSQSPRRSPSKFSTLGVTSGRTAPTAYHNEQASFIV